MSHQSKSEKILILQVRIMLVIAYVVARSAPEATMSMAFADIERLSDEFRKILKEG